MNERALTRPRAQRWRMGLGLCAGLLAAALGQACSDSVDPDQEWDEEWSEFRAAGLMDKAGGVDCDCPTCGVAVQASGMCLAVHWELICDPELTLVTPGLPLRHIGDARSGYARLCNLAPSTTYTVEVTMEDDDGAVVPVASVSAVAPGTPGGHPSTTQQIP